MKGNEGVTEKKSKMVEKRAKKKNKEKKIERYLKMMGYVTVKCVDGLEKRRYANEMKKTFMYPPKKKKKVRKNHPSYLYLMEITFLTNHILATCQYVRKRPTEWRG